MNNFKVFVALFIVGAGSGLVALVVSEIIKYCWGK